MTNLQQNFQRFIQCQSSLQYCIALAVALYFLGEIMNILEEKSIML